MKLRQYQKNSVSETYHYINNNKGLNPCLVLPTGAGKSIVIAKIAMDFFKKSNGRLLMLTHVSELIEQNYNKVSQLVNPDDVGLYSSGLGKKELDKKITFAGIQSIHSKTTPDYSVIIVDECHLINPKIKGTYREFIDKHPNAIVIGLTATPYRMDNGYINVGDDALFNDLIIPDGTTIPELISEGFLSTLKSKVSNVGNFDFKKVKKTNGDFNNGQVDNIVNHYGVIDEVVTDIIERTKDKKHVLIFCAGVDHTENVSDALTRHGEKSFYVHGKMSKSDRKMAVDSFKSSVLKYLCNPNILTTGFDFPNIDCVIMLRPTFSTGLYVQMAGRGLRLKSHTDHCVILDYVGNIERHGTIINPRVKDKKDDDKICPQCFEVNLHDAELCVDCGFDFSELIGEKEESETPEASGGDDKKEKSYALYDVDIMHDDNPPQEIEIQNWLWKTYKSKADGKKGVICEFIAADCSIKNIPLFLAVNNPKARYPIMSNFKKLQCQSVYAESQCADSFVDAMNGRENPSFITVRKDGAFWKLLKSVF